MDRMALQFKETHSPWLNWFFWALLGSLWFNSYVILLGNLEGLVASGCWLLLYVGSVAGAYIERDRARFRETA